MIMTARYKAGTKRTTFLKNHTPISVFYFSAICKKHIVLLVLLVPTDEDLIKKSSSKKVPDRFFWGVFA